MNVRISTTVPPSRLPRVAGSVGAVGFLLTGVVALVAPRAFFDAVARFEPYNQHFVQDIGAFNLGLGAVLLLAVGKRPDALLAALAGAAVGATAHVLSHVVGHDLGGTPVVDIPLFGLLAIVLGTAAWARRRELAD